MRSSCHQRIALSHHRCGLATLIPPPLWVLGKSGAHCSDRASSGASSRRTFGIAAGSLPARARESRPTLGRGLGRAARVRESRPTLGRGSEVWVAAARNGATHVGSWLRHAGPARGRDPRWVVVGSCGPGARARPTLGRVAPRAATAVCSVRPSALPRVWVRAVCHQATRRRGGTRDGLPLARPARDEPERGGPNAFVVLREPVLVWRYAGLRVAGGRKSGGPRASVGSAVGRGAWGSCRAGR